MMTQKRSVSIVQHQKRKTNLNGRGAGFRLWAEIEEKEALPEGNNDADDGVDGYPITSENLKKPSGILPIYILRFPGHS